MSAYFAKEDILKVLSKHDLWFSYISPDSWHKLKEQIKALPTVPLDWKSIMDDWTEHDNAMIAKGREIERRLNAPKHGHWIWDKENDKMYCSECGYETDNWGVHQESDPIKWQLPNYCENCGARMFDKDIDVPDKNVGKMDEVEE